MLGDSCEDEYAPKFKIPRTDKTDEVVSVGLPRKFKPGPFQDLFEYLCSPSDTTKEE
jgi:hypothetical protein